MPDSGSGSGSGSGAGEGRADGLLSAAEFRRLVWSAGGYGDLLAPAPAGRGAAGA